MAGFRLNRFAHSLRRAENRETFLADELAYLSPFGLNVREIELVRGRDWTGLLVSGAHLLAILKIATTVGQSLWDIGAHNAGASVAELESACPRRVDALPVRSR